MKNGALVELDLCSLADPLRWSGMRGFYRFLVSGRDMIPDTLYNMSTGGASQGRFECSYCLLDGTGGH